MRRLLWARAGVVVTVAAVGVLGFVAPAWAHVTVSPGTAPRGGDAVVSFQVPNEEDAVNTTVVEVHLPADKPIASVATQPVPGWTATTETTKLAKPIKSDDGEVTEAVTKITWTAELDGGIKPGQFQQFAVSFGSLPDTDSLELKVLQTYANGDVVRWIDDPAPAGQAEPAHPAPVLTLTKGDDDTAPAADTSAAAPAAKAAKSSNNDGTAIGFGVAGLVLGAAGLVLGFLAFRRRASTG